MNEASFAFRRLLRGTGFEFCDDDYEQSDSRKSDSDDALVLRSLIEVPVEESSSDDPGQSIDRVLLDDDTFWSSEGSSPSMKNVVEEYLTFKMQHPLNLVKLVEITVFRAVFQIGGPIYPPGTMAIFTGATLENLKKASRDFKIEPHDRKQEFHLPSGQQSLGRFIQFRFRGKQQMQREDNQYYIAIRRLDAFGLPAKSPNLTQLHNNLKSDWCIPRSGLTFLELSHHYNSESESCEIRTIAMTSSGGRETKQFVNRLYSTFKKN